MLLSVIVLLSVVTVGGVGLVGTAAAVTDTVTVHESAEGEAISFATDGQEVFVKVDVSGSGTSGGTDNVTVSSPNSTEDITVVVRDDGSSPDGTGSNEVYWGSFTLNSTTTDNASEMIEVHDGYDATIRSNLDSGTEGSATITADYDSLSVSITDPTGGDVVSSQNWINGTASDDNGVSSVNLTIQRDSDGNYWDGGAWVSGETTVAASADDGTFDSGTEDWNYDSSSITGEDTYTVTATATDVAGNTLADTASYTIDSSGLSDTYTLDTTVEVTGLTATNPQSQDIRVTVDADEQLSDLTASDGSGNTVSGVGTDFTETDNGDGTFTYEATYDAGADGDYTVTLDSASDTNGNTNGTTGLSDTVSIDTTAPTISAISLDNDGSDNLDLSFDSDEQLGTIGVTVDGPNTNGVYSFTEADFGETDNGDGTYTYTLTTTQAYGDGDGSYEAFVGDAIDAAGNNGGNNGGGSGLSDTYTLDTTVEVTGLTATNPQSQDVLVEVTAGEQLSDLTASDGSGNTVSGVGTGFTETDNGDGTFTYEATYDAGADGDYTVTLDSASDTNGNTNGTTGLSDTVSIDTTPPSISTVALDNDGSDNLDFSFDSDEQLDTIAVSVDGPSTTDAYTFDDTDFSETDNGGTYTYTLTTTQAYDDGDGQYVAFVDGAVDAAGNDGGNDGSGSGLSDTYSLDTTVEVTGLSATNPQNQDVEVTVDADEQLSDLTASDDGSTTLTGVGGDFTETNNGDGTYTYTATYDAGADGDYTVTLDSASDTAGNSNSSPGQSDTVSIDTTAPSITSVTLGNDGSDNLDVSFDSDETLDSISVTVDGPSTTDAYTFDETDFSASGGTYTLTTTQAYDDGDGQYEAFVDGAVDAAGNDGGNNGDGSGLSDTYSFDVTVEVTGLTATNPQNKDVLVTVDADEQLSDLTASDGSGNTVSGVGTDFTETDNGDGTFTYEATYDAGADGDYTVTLDSASDTAGNTDTSSGQSDTVSIGSSGGGASSGGSSWDFSPEDFEPTAAIDVDADPATVGEPVTFSASSSTVDAGGISDYEWVIDGETYDGETVTETFDGTGTIDIELTVSGLYGDTDTATASLTVRESDDGSTDGDDGTTDGDDGDEGVDTSDDGGSGDGDDDGSIPGFGVTVAVVALLSVALLARRR